MRNVSLLMHVSLDGFVGGPNGEMDWICHDEAIFEDVTKLFESVDTALYGRTTYHMMENYWPAVPSNPASTKRDIQHAEWVERINKIVFSTTLERADWNNTRLIRDHVAEEIARLKQQPGKELMIFGSPRLTHSFLELGLIDAFHLYINPVVLGAGIPLFRNVREKTELELLHSRPFASGVVSLHYRKK